MSLTQDIWRISINVREYLVSHYTPYDGDESFLAPPTPRTLALWEKVKALMREERERGGVYDIDNTRISTITSHEPGFIDRDLEQIVGIQTDTPLKRAIMPFGGIRMVQSSLKAYQRELPEDIENVFKYRKTHNDGVFDAYSDEMKLARHNGIITGLPDAYGRGRIIGDYRRLPLYGIDFLIAHKEAAKARHVFDAMDLEAIQLREEISEQIRALQELKAMAASYGFDISQPAQDTKEAIQWLYFAYLAAVKEQNGAAMSIGRVSTFLDIYAERDLAAGRYTEEQIQEFVDHFVMKLRMVRFLRTPGYDALFSGDPTWITESLGGIGVDGRHMVTKMSFRFLHTLINLGPAPEPNMTVLWSARLPAAFKRYCARLSITTSSIQYENDELMREKFGDDYGIACCVSAMRIGKQMQFFGARTNLAKALLYCINGGKDEITGQQVGPEMALVTSEYLISRRGHAQVRSNLPLALAPLYQYAQRHPLHARQVLLRTAAMALHDEDVFRTAACGIAGLSVVADAFSAIKYARVKPIRDKRGLTVDFEIEGDFKFGNNDPRVDDIAVEVVKSFMGRLSNIVPTVTPSRRSRSSRSPRTWCTAKRPAPRPTAARRASPSRPARTRCTDATRTAVSRR